MKAYGPTFTIRRPPTAFHNDIGSYPRFMHSSTMTVADPTPLVGASYRRLSASFSLPTERACARDE